MVVSYHYGGQKSIYGHPRLLNDLRLVAWVDASKDKAVGRKVSLEEELP